MAQRRLLVLGLGNSLAGDDGFGGAVTEALRRRRALTGDAEVRDAGTDLLSEIDGFGQYDEVVLVDAVLDADRAGDVAVFDEATFARWPEDAPGCHGISPLVAVKLFRTLHPEANTRITLVALCTDALRVGGKVPDSVVAVAVTRIVQDIIATQPVTGPFQVCGSCRTPWRTWDQFVLDPKITFLGLQAMPGLPDANLLIFEHGCGSSVSILTKRLRALLPDETASWPSLRGSEQCPGHCRSLKDYEMCDRRCSNAHDRELIKLVQRVREQRPGRAPIAAAGREDRTPQSTA